VLTLISKLICGPHWDPKTETPLCYFCEVCALF